MKSYFLFNLSGLHHSHLQRIKSSILPKMVITKRNFRFQNDLYFGSKKDKYFIGEYDDEHDPVVKMDFNSLINKYYEEESEYYLGDEFDDDSKSGKYLKKLWDMFSYKGRFDSESSYKVETILNTWKGYEGYSKEEEIAEAFLTQKELFRELTEKMNEDIVIMIMGKVLTDEQIDTFYM